MNNILKRISLVSLVGVLVVSQSITSFAALPSKEQVTNTGVSIKVPSTLNIVQPSQNTNTTSATYYVMGTSNPNSKLYMNGTEITDRGSKGSFGVVLNLALGKNIIEVTQGGSTDKVVITRVANASQMPISKTTTLTKAYPTFDDCVPAGTELELFCVAPAGADVVATINGKKVQLSQAVQGATTGVAANFKAKYTMPETSSHTKNIGKVKYTMTYGGKTTAYYSEADLYTASKDAAIIVQNNENASPTYIGDNNNTAISTILAFGTVDRVIDQTNTLYRISMGGWVPKKYFKPLEGNWAYKNKISNVELRSSGNVEEIAFTGTTFPSFDLNLVDGNLVVDLYNSSGIDFIPVENSSIFSGATVIQEGTKSIITLTPKTSSSLWGYTIEYNNGETVLVCKKKPKLSSDEEKPLNGVTVAIDAGHGGYDPGALGPTGTTGATESDLTLATAIATKNMLEGLGAKVIMSRTTDTMISYNDRMFTALNNRADFLISIHYNSTTYPSARGMEVYSFGQNSTYFAQALQTNIANATGITNRGNKSMAFRMALNTSCPTVLIESAFISNPIEYDNICSTTWLYNMAVGIKNGILATLI